MPKINLFQVLGNIDSIPTGKNIYTIVDYNNYNKANHVIGVELLFVKEKIPTF